MATLDIQHYLSPFLTSKMASCPPVQACSLPPTQHIFIIQAECKLKAQVVKQLSVSDGFNLKYTYTARHKVV